MFTLTLSAIVALVLAGVVARARLGGFFRAFLASDAGAITLVEQRKTFQNPLQARIVETFIQSSRVLDFIPIEPREGNAYSYNEEATLPGSEFRGVNSAYVESTGTVSQKTENWSILGGVARIDRALINTSPVDQVDRQVDAKLKSIVYKLQDTFINGDVAVDANSFDGLKKRLTGGQVLDAATNGLNVVGASDADRHAFFDILDQALGLVPGPNSEKVLFMNDLILSKIRSSARRLGIGLESQEAFEGGPNIERYHGAPLLDIGNKADGTRIIPQTETQGSSTVASSIYVVRPTQVLEAENGVVLLGFGNQTAPDPEEERISNPPSVEITAEFYPGMAVFGKGAARLRGVLNG